MQKQILTIWMTCWKTSDPRPRPQARIRILKMKMTSSLKAEKTKRTLGQELQIANNKLSQQIKMLLFLRMTPHHLISRNF